MIFIRLYFRILIKKERTNINYFIWFRELIKFIEDLAFFQGFLKAFYKQGYLMLGPIFFIVCINTSNWCFSEIEEFILMINVKKVKAFHLLTLKLIFPNSKHQFSTLNSSIGHFKSIRDQNNYFFNLSLSFQI